MKIAIFTAIFGTKDNLIENQPSIEGVNYICFTDTNFISKTWNVIKTDLWNDDVVRTSKMCKILPHIFLKDYDYTIWVDGHCRVSEMIVLPVKELEKGKSFIALRHDKHTSLYEEAEYCIKIGKVRYIDIIDQINRYKSDGYKSDNGLFKNSIIWRRNDDPNLNSCMEDWWDEIKNGCFRDQLSLMYVFWKRNFSNFLSIDNTADVQGKLFNQCPHNDYNQMTHGVEMEISSRIMSDILNEIAEYNHYKSFLGIGLNQLISTLLKVNSKKIMGKNDFIQYALTKINNSYDMIFIEGSGNYSNVSANPAEKLQKILNFALDLLKDDGCIILEGTTQKNESDGISWKVAMIFRCTHPDLHIETIDIHPGYTIIRKARNDIVDIEANGTKMHLSEDVSFECFDRNRKDYLNLVSYPDYFKNIEVVLKGGGLCNRLKYLISVWRRSEIFKKRMKVYWTDEIHCSGCHLSDLFENDFEYVYSCPDKTTTIEQNLYIPFPSAFRFCLLDTDIPIGFGRVQPLTEKDSNAWKVLAKYPKQGQNIDYEYSRIPTNLKNDILSYFRRLVPVKKIRDILSEQRKQIGENTIGVHLRRTDHMLKNDRNMGVDSLVFEYMESEIAKNDKANFFISTDEVGLEDRYEKKFPGKIIKYTKRMAGRYIVSHMNTESSVSRTGIENIQDALIDVLLLAECKKILGTKLSTFTECAWWFGGCKDILIME